MSTVIAPNTNSIGEVSLITADDLHLFNEGTHYDLWKKLGSHVLRQQDGIGTYFAVWAPNAASVSVVGDFNAWNRKLHPLRQRGRSGIWEAFLPNVESGARYKYHIVSRSNGY